MQAHLFISIIILQVLIACQSEDFRSSDGGKQPSSDKDNPLDTNQTTNQTSTSVNRNNDVVVNTRTNTQTRTNTGDVTGDGGTLLTEPCSDNYMVSARSNPYLAGMPNGRTISYYPYRTDSAPSESPTLVTPTSLTCLQAGRALYFNVSGDLSRGQGYPTVNADGEVQSQIDAHQRGAWFGKSNIRAPYVSLLGVFLTGQSPEGSVAPAMLDFSNAPNATSRDYAELRPLIGQVFFIGDGKDSQGRLQKVIVPAGATRFYFAVMDIYEWVNNTGGLTAGILVKRN